MNTPLAIKTTISSRLKANQMNENGNGPGHREIPSNNQSKSKSIMPPPSQIARNRALRTPAPPSTSNSRLANLANGFQSSMKDGKLNVVRQNNNLHTSSSIAKTTTHMTSTTTNAHQNDHKPTTNQTTSSRLHPPMTSKIGRQTKTTTAKGSISSNNTNNDITSGQRISTSNSRISSVAPLTSRSSSVVSSLSSVTTPKYSQQHNTTSSSAVPSNNIPNTTTVRKGLAKFSNPIECQRQYQALSLKVRQTCEIVEAREKEIDQLQEQLKHSIQVGVGYATTVQYFAKKLKLDSDLNLLEECEQLKSKVDTLMINEKEYESKLDAIVDDYKNHLQVEHDLRNNLERELDETRKAHSENIKGLKVAHETELNDLIEKHSNIEKELQSRIEVLETELETKCKDLSELTKEHECLKHSFSKLEESLTKDKDARVKYAQEKITQLQKDVDSLNSVLEMRLERVHALEKDSLLLAETQNELETQKDVSKALNQQLESLNAALEKKREQYETLIAEHEKIRQELIRERKERRRMTMKTEQLQFALNESCASESNMGYNSSINDLDNGSDHLV